MGGSVNGCENVTEKGGTKKFVRMKAQGELAVRSDSFWVKIRMNKKRVRLEFWIQSLSPINFKLGKDEHGIKLNKIKLKRAEEPEN